MIYITESYDIDYKNTEEETYIRVISTGEKFFAAWQNNNELELVFHYNNKTKQIEKFEGELEKYINRPEFSTEEKIQRVMEALNNGLWDYFHPIKTATIKKTL